MAHWNERQLIYCLFAVCCGVYILILNDGVFSAVFSACIFRNLLLGFAYYGRICGAPGSAQQQELWKTGKSKSLLRIIITSIEFVVTMCHVVVSSLFSNNTCVCQIDFSIYISYLQLWLNTINKIFVKSILSHYFCAFCRFPSVPNTSLIECEHSSMFSYL